MTQKQNKLLFNKYFLPITILVVLLVGFFIFAWNGNSQIFLFVAALQIIVLAFLYYFRSTLNKEFSNINIIKEQYREQINLLRIEIEKESLAKQSFFDRVAVYAKLKNFAEDLSVSATCQETVEIIVKKTDELFGGQGETVILIFSILRLESLALFRLLRLGQRQTFS